MWEDLDAPKSAGVSAVLLLRNTRPARMLTVEDADTGARIMALQETDEFFNSYAGDFAALYGAEHTCFNRVINRIFRKSMWARFTHTLAACRPVAGKTVLDVGCGPGHYAVALAQEGVSAVTGIDFAPAMVELARTRAAAAGVAERCTFMVGDFLTHEFAAPFDYVVLMGLMDYMADAPAAISRALTLARGKVLFSFPAAGGVLALQRRWRYRGKCPLFMYSRKHLQSLFTDIPPACVTIDKLHRDYFVTVTRHD